MSTNDPGPEVVTPRSNVVTITDESNTITSTLFIPGSLHVSENQPFDPAPKILRDGNVFTISLEAGRQTRSRSPKPSITLAAVRTTNTPLSKK